MDIIAIRWPIRSYGLSQQSVNERCMGYATWADIPTFEEIKPEDLPPFGKKHGRFLCSENIAIFYLLVTQNEPIFSRFDITKQH